MKPRGPEGMGGGDEASGLLRTLVRLEERFWRADARFYRENLSENCLMILPGVGVLSREAAIEGIENGPRWAAVDITEARITELAHGAMVLTYRALATREGRGVPYEALVSSAYVERDGGWKLAFHHQTPARPR